MNYTWDWEPRCQQPWMESTICYFLVRLKGAYQWMWTYLSEKTHLGPTAPNWISQLPLPLCLHPSLSARCQPVTRAHVLFEAPGVRKSSPWLYPHSWTSPGDGCFVLVCPVIWQDLRVPFALGGILPTSAHHLDAWEPEKPSLSVQRKLRLWEGTWLLQGHIVRQLGPVLCPPPSARAAPGLCPALCCSHPSMAFWSFQLSHCSPTLPVPQSLLPMTPQASHQTLLPDSTILLTVIRTPVPLCPPTAPSWQNPELGSSSCYPSLCLTLGAAWLALPMIPFRLHPP